MLTVSTNGSYDDVTQSEAAGIAEGYITADHIMMYYNATAAGYCDNNSDFCYLIYFKLGEIEKR